MKQYLRLLSYLKPYKKKILLTWLISLMVLMLQALSVWVGADFIEKLLSGDASSVPRDIGALAAFMDRIATVILERTDPFFSLITAVVVLLGAAFLTTCLRVLKTYLFAGINNTIIRQIRTEMFEHLTRVDLSFSRSNRSGEISSLFIQDTDQLKTAIIDAADRIFMQPVRLVMALALMLSLSVELTIWTFSFLIISSLSIHLAGNRIERLSGKLMKKLAKLQGHLTEYLSAVILARSLGREEEEKEKFFNACESVAKTNVELSIVRALAPQIINNLFTLAGGVLLMIGGYKVLVSKSLSGSVLIKMIFLVPVASYPIESLAYLYLSVRSSLASAKRVFKIFEEKKQAEDVADALEPQPLKKAIYLTNVDYCTNGASILKDISLQIPKGRITAICGPSGAGKTTLLSLIAGFLRPCSGKITIDEIDLRKIKSAAWCRNLGIVTQEPILLNGTVRDNLSYANPGASEAEMIEALRSALLWDDESVFAQGLETPVGNRGEFISGGERQRFAIARALLNNPDIVLLDEPTAMLDLENREKIHRTILNIATRKTIVLITHDPQLRDIGDQVIQIKSGRIVQQNLNVKDHAAIVA